MSKVIMSSSDLLFSFLIIFFKVGVSLSEAQLLNQNQANFYPDFDSNPSSDYYSDKAYYEYAREYQYNLRMSASGGGELGSNYYEEDYADAADRSSDTEQAKISDGDKDVTKKESYLEMASTLKCDNPWFWNAIKCTWLDVKGNSVGERTRQNAKTSAVFIGIPLTLLLVSLCGLCITYYLKYGKRLELLKLRKRYTPGRIQLPSGKYAKYDPTQEETKAYEELIKAIIIQETADRF